MKKIKKIKTKRIEILILIIAILFLVTNSFTILILSQNSKSNKAKNQGFVDNEVYTNKAGNIEETNNIEDTNKKVEVTIKKSEKEQTKEERKEESETKNQEQRNENKEKQEKIREEKADEKLEETRVIIYSDDYKGNENEFTINVYINSSIEILAAHFELSFDNSIIEAMNVTEGDFMKQGGHSLPTTRINNTEGRISFIDTIFGYDDKVEPTGNGQLSSIIFKVKKKGVSNLKFEKTRVAKTNNKVIDIPAIDSKIEII